MLACKFCHVAPAGDSAAASDAHRSAASEGTSSSGGKGEEEEEGEEEEDSWLEEVGSEEEALALWMAAAVRRGEDPSALPPLPRPPMPLASDDSGSGGGAVVERPSQGPGRIIAPVFVAPLQRPAQPAAVAAPAAASAVAAAADAAAAAAAMSDEDMLSQGHEQGDHSQEKQPAASGSQLPALSPAVPAGSGSRVARAAVRRRRAGPSQQEEDLDWAPPSQPTVGCPASFGFTV